jgi:hypothetical protein
MTDSSEKPDSSAQMHLSPRCNTLMRPGFLQDTFPNTELVKMNAQPTRIELVASLDYVFPQI